jgi:4-amino-4-deoxy-L-arabinose transferase-like glycosyltransferase
MVNVPNNKFQLKISLLISLLGVILLRVISISWLAIYDPTESRYAEIANHMYRSGNWLTPKLYMDGKLVPYWGKPPLHFWLTAGSYTIFGISEWSSRLPSLFAGLLILCMTMYLVRRIWGMRTAAISGIVLSSSFLFFVLWGASIVDVTLAAAVTLSMVTFALTIVETRTRSRRWWGYCFFLSLAGGMLSKGPVAIVLVALAIGLWLIFVRKWESIKTLPWIGGTLLFLALSIPWFVLAERATPGFLRYFFINEQVLRFLVHDYGDKYGSGHIYRPGAIWVMLLVGYLPWTFFLIATLVREYRNRFSGSERPNGIWLKYAMAWGLTPAIFFTFSRQLLATYLLPGFAGLSIVTAVGLEEWLNSSSCDRAAKILGWHVLIPLALLVIEVGIGVVFQVSFFITASTTILTLGLAIAVNELRGTDKLAPIALLGLSISVLIVVGMLNLGRALDVQHSTKPLLAHLSQNKSSIPLRVCFPFGEPSSAYFYQEIYSNPNIEHNGRKTEAILSNEIKAHSADIFVFTRKQWDTLGPQPKNELIPVEEMGTWIACKEKQARIGIQGKMRD